MSDTKKNNTVKPVEKVAKKRSQITSKAQAIGKALAPIKAAKRIAVKKDLKKDSIVAKLKKLLAKKRKHPVFRGRFGVRSIRSKSVEKFNKWRVPRGIDIKWEKGDGTRVTIGYGNPKEIRGVHPSGYREVLVGNINDLKKINKESHAARIRSTVGKKKRIIIKAEAEKKGIKVLN